MPVEGPVTYISDLVASNPIHATDPVSQGDDHLRNIKLALLNTFPNITGEVSATHTELNHLDGVTGVTGTGDLALAADPTFTGTLTAAAIAATTYDGITAANLVDKSAVETITGTWTFTNLVGGVLTATSYGGIAEADLVDKSATETIGGAWTFTPGIGVQNVDTVITRAATGKIEVEGRPIITHDDAALGSGRIFFSNGVEPTTEGNDGDIFLVY